MDRSGANEDTYPMLVISRLITVTYLHLRFLSNLHDTGFSSCWITIMIHSYLVCVCVCTICIDVKLHFTAGVTRVPGGRWPTKTPPGYLWKQTCSIIYIYLYIVPPLGAYKTQLGGTYILSLLFYMVIVIVYCDYTSLYYIHTYIYDIIYIYHSSCQFIVGVFARVLSKCVAELCHQVPRLPHYHQAPRVPHKSRECHQMPCRPRRATRPAQRRRCHTCHTKVTSMSPNATPATSKTAASPASPGTKRATWPRPVP